MDPAADGFAKMIEIAIPGFRHLTLEHLVLDFNGTLAVDGRLIDGVRDRMQAIGRDINIHVITADTFGGVQKSLEAIPCTLHLLPVARQDQGKRDYVRRLGSIRVAAVGNGRNDSLMLAESALGIGVIQAEGAFGGTLTSADVVCTSILDALDLLTHPLRLTATLRA